MSMRPLVLLVAVGVLGGGCHPNASGGGESRQDGALVDAAPAPAATGPAPPARAGVPRTRYRCEKSWTKDGGKVTAMIEEHGDTHWFCSHLVELETRAPIAIEREHVDEEFSEWTLRVGGVPLEVRVDSEWTNLAAHGWRPTEIEHVIYAEVFGRSARRAEGSGVRREADLIFATDRVLRVHYRYTASPDDAVEVDETIDRTHVPLCLQSSGCDGGM
jgi:hypothetical protein